MFLSLSSFLLILLTDFTFLYFQFQSEVIKSRNKDVVDLFDLSIGVHHAGMLRSDRTMTERLFSDGFLKVRVTNSHFRIFVSGFACSISELVLLILQLLVCTATLAWGVNLPAHTVVIKVFQPLNFTFAFRFLSYLLFSCLDATLFL